MKKIFTVLSLVLFCATAFAQNDDDLYEMSLEDIMNISIESASKKKESLFEAPLPSYTITKQELINSGATSIPEALRLAPGVIVREQSNGNFDVHIRGMENLARYTPGQRQANQSALVMINNRPVFNPTLGATYWESLPVGIDDIERIEIVSGPAAPLFGPNAVTGVINIITTGEVTEGSVRGNVQYGTDQTLVAGFGITDVTENGVIVGMNANFQHRDRGTESYYDFASDTYVDSFWDLTPGAQGAESPLNFTDADRALTMFGINARVYVPVQEDFDIDLTTGYQSSWTQKAYLMPKATPFNMTTSESKYVNLASNFKNLKARVSYLSSTDNMNLEGATGVVSSQYDVHYVQAELEYKFAVSDRLDIIPGFNYQQYTIDPMIAVGQINIIPVESEIDNTAFSLRADYKVTDALRLIAGARADKFSTPDEMYISYQAAATYALNENHLIRASYGTSSSGSFVGNAFLDLELRRQFTPNPAGPIFLTKSEGNKEMDPFTVSSFELGYRGKLSSNFHVDVAMFIQDAQDTYLGVKQPLPPNAVPGSVHRINDNIGLTAKQTGFTLGINYATNSGIQIKPFITYQTTEVTDIPSQPNSVALNPVDNIETGFDDDNLSTPEMYGGAYINLPFGKWNINLNPYFMGEHTLFNERDIDPTIPDNGVNPGLIDAKFILNAKVNYRVSDAINLYVNARNAFNNESREYYGTDEMRARYMVGASFTLK